MVKVDVEYCGKCNFQMQCAMLRNFLLDNDANVEVVCHIGRQGSFEVKVDDTLVHSKLQSMAFPKHDSILENVQRAEKKLPLIKVEEQPIKDCILM